MASNGVSLSDMKKGVSKKWNVDFQLVFFIYEKRGIKRWNLGFLLSVAHMKKGVSKDGISIFH